MIAELTRAYPGGRWRAQTIGEVTGYVAGRNVRVERADGGYRASILFQSNIPAVTAPTPVSAVATVIRGSKS